MRKNITNYRYTKTFSILAAIFLSSFLFLTCKISFESDLKGYLKDYTEEVEIIGYETSSPLKSIDGKNEYYIDNSNNAFSITFSIRNPQKFNFGTAEAFAKENTKNKNDKAISTAEYNLYSQFKNYSIKKDNDNIIDENKLAALNFVTIKQSSDLYKITLTIPATFLSLAEGGETDITPTIHLQNPVTKKLFEEYETLHIVCNSPPTDIVSPVVYEDIDNDNEHILIFNMPDENLLKGIHKDIKTLIINDQKKDIIYDVNTNEETGKFELSSQSTSGEYYKAYYTDPTDTNNKDDYKEEFSSLGQNFQKNGQPVYIRVKGKSNEYTFTLKDNAGLYSEPKSATVKSSPHLATPYVIRTFKDNKGKDTNELIREGLSIKQDDNDSMATIKFVPALYTYWLEDNDGAAQNLFRYEKNGTFIPESFTFDEKTFDPSQSHFNNLTNENIKELREKFWIKNNKGDKDTLTYENKINSWTIPEPVNTSKIKLHYKITDCNNNVIDDSYSFEKESSGKSPKLNKDYTIDFSDSKLETFTTKIPCGPVSISVYATVDSDDFLESPTYEFSMEVLRTRVYTGPAGDDNNPGTVTKPFKSLPEALNSLSIPEDTANTVYLLGNIDDNIIIPETGPSYVKICSSGSATWAISSNNTNEPVLTIPENATVILENLKVSGNIIVGKGAKLYLNNVEMDKGIIEANEDSHVILGGTTTIKADLNDNGEVILDSETGKPTDNCAYILIKKTESPNSTGATVQIGENSVSSPSITYNTDTAELVLIDTEDPYPDLNTVILESESTKSSASSLPAMVRIRQDLEDEDNPFQLFKLLTKEYYIEYSDSDSTKGKIVTGIPAAKVTEPEIGGFTISLDKQAVYGVWTYQLSTSIVTRYITATITKDNEDYTDKVTDRKFQLSMEGDLIRNLTSNIADGKASIRIPYDIAPGKYALTISFTYAGISYSEELLLNLKK